MKKLVIALTLVAVIASQTISASQSNRDALLNEVAVILSELATMGAPVNDTLNEISSMDEANLKDTLTLLQNYKNQQLKLAAIAAQSAALDRQETALGYQGSTSSTAPAPVRRKGFFSRLFSKE